MVVNLSNEAKVLIQQYKKALLKSPYRCTKERSNELGKEMLDTIVKEASNADSLQVCPYKTLGQVKDKEDKPQKQNLRWFQYKSPSTSTWGVSVLCDFENDVATVHRIVHSSFIKESSMRWIPLQDFNKQIQEENTMKKLNITRKQYNESRYFQKKYGKLEYVSESGKVFKTSKGHLIKLLQESDEDDDRLWILITIEDDDSTNVDVFNRKESVREHLINSDNFDDEDIDEIMTNGKVDVGWCRVELWHCPIED